jgi:hypothetical protein
MGVAVSSRWTNPPSTGLGAVGLEAFLVVLLVPFPDFMRRQVFPLDEVEVPMETVVLVVEVPMLFCWRSSDAFGLLVALDCLLLLPLRNILQVCNRLKTAGTDKNR